MLGNHLPTEPCRRPLLQTALILYDVCEARGQASMHSLLALHGSQAHKVNVYPTNHSISLPPFRNWSYAIAQAGLKNQFLSCLLATEVSRTQPGGGYWMPFCSFPFSTGMARHHH